MKKMNKKGFTLIEMLVVIAIIAVLVSIIIPTVTSATDKAAAATNAANLRSVKAEIVTAMLAGDLDAVTGITIAKATGENATGYTVSGSPTGVTFKDLTAKPANATGTFSANANFAASCTGLEVTVTYDGLTIDDWAAAAG